jgi:hypothetical protein
MAVANTKSNRIGLAEAIPQRQQPGILNGAITKSLVATLEVAAADDNNSIYRFCRLHSSWNIRSIRAFSDAITSGTDFNFGLWQTAENGGAVVVENCYADAVDLSSGLAGTEIAFENRNIDKVENRVWQDAGLSADSNRFYELCAIGIAVGSAAGTITLIVEYATEA